jgi:hypothetical protein
MVSECVNIAKKHKGHDKKKISILEIGPGTGALTEHLLQTGLKVTAIEADDRAIPVLEKKFDSYIKNGDLTLLHKDIREFRPQDMNKSYAQLIFTTHETSVLNQDTFRRDQIWFCEKQKRATKLYPLTDFSPRKGVEDLEKGYLSGRYGALPFFKDISMAMGK